MNLDRRIICLAGEFVPVNSSQLLLLKPELSTPALRRAFRAKGLMRPLGMLPAPCARTSFPNSLAR